MSNITVQIKGGQPAEVPGEATIAEALKRLDRDAAKQALAARINGREFDSGTCPGGVAPSAR